MYAAKRDKKRVMKRTDIKGNKKQTTLYFRLHAELTSNFRYINCLVFVVLVAFQRQIFSLFGVDTNTVKFSDLPNIYWT